MIDSIFCEIEPEKVYAFKLLSQNTPLQMGLGGRT